MDSIVEITTYVLLFVLLYYQVFLLLSFFEKKPKEQVSKKSTSHFPSVTILVPCFNEETTIARTVESLLALDYPKDKLFINLIDDGSTDGTLAAMNQYASGYPQIRTYTKPNEGKWKTLNFGLKKTTTEMVGCLDADSFVEPNALKEIVSLFQNDANTMAVIPTIRIYKPNNLIRMMQKAEYDIGTFVKKTLANLGAIHITPGPFSIFRRKVFSQLGFYKHAHNTEDFEIALRMQKAGMKIDNAEKAIVYTVGPENARKLYKQRVRWTGGFFQNLIDYRDILFAKRFGMLGGYILPMTIFAVFGTLYFTFLGIFFFGQNLIIRFENLRLVNYDFVWPSLSSFFDFNLFFVNTHAIGLISFGLLLTTLLFIFLGRKVAGIKQIITFDIVVFMGLYGFIAPFWLAKSVYNTVMSRDASWR